MSVQQLIFGLPCKYISYLLLQKCSSLHNINHVATAVIHNYEFGSHPGLHLLSASRNIYRVLKHTFFECGKPLHY